MSLSRRSVLATGALAVGLSSAGCGRGVRQSFSAADTHPETYPTVQAVRYMAERLSERSDGRMRINTYPGSVLGQEKDTLEIAVFGGIDFNRVNLAPLNSIAEETIVPNLPFMFRSIAHMRAAMDGAPGQRILEALIPHGLIGLCFYDSGARSFYTTKREIHRPEDLKGLKIRVQSSDLYVSMVRALGGNATPMDFGEVYQGLLQGTVDGAENNWPSYETTRHFEAARNYSLTRHVMAPEVLVMSRRAWLTLSIEQQDLIRTCARESVAVMRKLWDERVARSKEIVLQNGNKIIEPDTQLFQQKVEPIWARYLSSPALRSLADEIQDVGASI